MAFIDPTTVRLSDSFLLSDFMGCDSVYRRGFRNQISDADNDKIREGKYLAEQLDEAQEKFGPFSVTYGYISPELSRKIVTYQSPNKPSYHRWDHGAAADIVPHFWYSREIQSNYQHKNDNAPIYFAHSLAHGAVFSRIITYAESEVICFATRIVEAKSTGRRAFYENRYVGKREPKHVKYPTARGRFADFAKDVTLEHDWQGQGHPSYHGSGNKQYEHHRLDDNVILSDFLYIPERVHKGVANIPWTTGSRAACCFEQCLEDATEVMDALISEFQYRFSIVTGFERSKATGRNWTKYFNLELVPSINVDIYEAADYLEGFDKVHSVRIRKMNRGDNRIVLTGRRHESLGS